MPIPSYRLSFNGEAAADDIYENLIRLELEEEIHKATSFVFRLSIALQEDGEWSYLDDERFSLFTRVAISLGAGEGDVTPLFTGYITHLAPHFDPEEELCYLEVRGMDPTCLMNLEEKMVTWEDQSHSEIATAIFGAYGITADVEESPTRHGGDGNVLVQRGTDIRFLKELAARNGFDCYVAVDERGEPKGCFKPWVLDGAPLPPLAVQFEGETNVQFLDVQANGTRPLGVAGWHLNLDDKALEEVAKDEYGQSSLGRETLPAIVRNRLDSLSVPLAGSSRVHQSDFVFLDSTELERALQNSQDGYGWFIKAKGTVNAEDYGAVIRARRVIPVKGMGTRYSGNYLVAAVKHLIADGRYEQQVELIRNAWGVTGDEAFAGES